MKCKVCGKDHHDYGIKPAPVVTIGTNADKTYTAADLAKAREEGRRDGLEGVRKIMTYDETATSRGLGQGNTWDVIKRTYTIDADVFDALLAEGKKEGKE